MITYNTSLRRVLARATPLPAVKIPLDEARGRILASQVSARLDMPPFDQSAMDGYAVLMADIAGATSRTPVCLWLAGEIPAGDPRRLRLRPGQTVKVFTGSRLPAGCEAVVMREYCTQQENRILVTRDARVGEHIRYRGEELARGDPLLEAGERITPPLMGLLATFGHATVAVHRTPTVTLITIGDELVPLGARLKVGQIYNSNAIAMRAALAELGLTEIHAATLPDDVAILRRAMQRGLRSDDVLITVGGASVGDYDFVRGVTAELGIAEEFRRIAIKPGKPNFFGTWRRPSSSRRSTPRLVFGLPGNPVSALVSYHQLVKPALLRMMGSRTQARPTLTARLTAGCRKRAGRLEWLRGVLSVGRMGGTGAGQLRVRPVSRQGSHMMSGLAEADCLIQFPRSASKLARGAEVEVRLLSWRD